MGGEQKVVLGGIGNQNKSFDPKTPENGLKPC
jgi:hypothetical protein